MPEVPSEIELPNLSSQSTEFHHIFFAPHLLVPLKAIECSMGPSVGPVYQNWILQVVEPVGRLVLPAVRWSSYHLIWYPYCNEKNPADFWRRLRIFFSTNCGFWSFPSGKSQPARIAFWICINPNYAFKIMHSHAPVVFLQCIYCEFLQMYSSVCVRDGKGNSISSKICIFTLKYANEGVA